MDKQGFESSHGPRILVIEDEPTIIEFLRTGLTYEGYRVTVAPDGCAGFDAINREGYGPGETTCPSSCSLLAGRYPTG